MPAAATIDFPQEDVKALFKQIDRAVRQLNMPLGKAVRQAANMVSRTIGTSTNLPTRDVKAKKRIVKEVRGSKRRDGMKLFEVTSWRGGSKKKSRIIAKNMSQAKKSPKVRIGKYGLARATWVRIASRIGGGALSAGGATSSAKKSAARLGKTTHRLRGPDPFVKMVNELNYATDALRGGENEVETAMARAARGMAKSLDKQLVKKMRAA